MKCEVLTGHTLRHKGELHNEGAVVDLPEDEAKRLIESGHVEAVRARKAPAKAAEAAEPDLQIQEQGEQG